MRNKTQFFTMFILVSCAPTPSEEDFYFSATEPGEQPHIENTDSDIVVLTDLVTKSKVSLEEFDGWTRVTDLETDDYLDIEGEWADVFDDDSYTEMMEEKRSLDEERQSETMNALSGHGSFSISRSWATPSYPKTGSDPVKTNIGSLSTYNPSDHSVRIELKRSISFWFDASYGTREYWTGGSGGTKTWGSATSSGNYYLVISIPTYTGYWSTGSYSLWD